MGHLVLNLFKVCLMFTPLCPSKVGASFRSDGSPFPKSPMQFEAIYQFGDSLSDTGNLIRQPMGANSPYKGLPYGQSYHPTGRASDGLLMVDYIAKYFHLPLLNPYFAKGSDFTHGVNFAVAGATANGGDHCLAKQLEWFRCYLNSTFANNSTTIKKRLQKSLVLMGEIGGNDFNGPFNQNQTIAKVSKLIPGVVKTIKDAVEEVIRLGARNIIVPGNFAIGCVPHYLSKFATNDASKYDELHCLKDYNEFAKCYNQQLIEAIQLLQKQHPNVTIVYADYYSALTSVITNASKLGIEPDGATKACCASGDNPFNYGAKFCGNPETPVCRNPSKRLSWDGVHMTQQGYKYVADKLLKQFVPALKKHARSIDLHKIWRESIH